MARPIPVNQAGLRREYGAYLDAAVPVWSVAQHTSWADSNVIAPSSEARAGNRLLFIGQLLLVVSGLTGVLDMVFALELWPVLAASDFGLDETSTVFLLTAGAFLVATAIYAAWRTQCLHILNQSPWEVRFMAYTNLVIGAVATLILILALLVVVAIIAALIGLVALSLRGIGSTHEV